ncbi:hypothetical protein M1N55_07345, partial [Dehalococcoidia bacterium]|nr:hypothetical protein [Dehalococcoidia bacterium]
MRRAIISIIFISALGACTASEGLEETAPPTVDIQATIQSQQTSAEATSEAKIGSLQATNEALKVSVVEEKPVETASVISSPTPTAVAEPLPTSTAVAEPLPTSTASPVPTATSVTSAMIPTPTPNVTEIPNTVLEITVDGDLVGLTNQKVNIKGVQITDYQNSEFEVWVKWDSEGQWKGGNVDPRGFVYAIEQNIYANPGQYTISIWVSDRDTGDVGQTDFIMTVLEPTSTPTPIPTPTPAQTGVSYKIIGYGIGNEPGKTWDITEDTYWSAYDGPYLITHTIRVSDGIKLTIGSGAKVAIANGFDRATVISDAYAVKPRDSVIQTFGAANNIKVEPGSTRLTTIRNYS